MRQNIHAPTAEQVSKSAGGDVETAEEALSAVQFTNELDE